MIAIQPKKPKRPWRILWINGVQLTFWTYRLYLESWLWKEDIRPRVMARDHSRCLCGMPATQGHHDEYSSDVLIGKTIDGIRALCEPCHEWVGRNGGQSRNLAEQRAQHKRLTIPPGLYVYLLHPCQGAVKDLTGWRPYEFTQTGWYHLASEDFRMGTAGHNIVGGDILGFIPLGHSIEVPSKYSESEVRQYFFQREDMKWRPPDRAHPLLDKRHDSVRCKFCHKWMCQTGAREVASGEDWWCYRCFACDRCEHIIQGLPSTLPWDEKAYLCMRLADEYNDKHFPDAEARQPHPMFSPLFDYGDLREASQKVN